MADPTPIVLTWTSGGIFFGATLVRMLAVGATIQSLKKAVDTELDPKTLQASEVFIGSTTRGHRAVTEADLARIAAGEPLEDVDEFESSATTITANTTKSRVFRRPLWFTRILPIMPLGLGALYGAVLVPMTIVVGGIYPLQLFSPNFELLIAVICGVLMGVGEGASSGQLYKAWDSMDGWGGLLRFAVGTGKFLVRKKTGQPPENTPE